MVSKGCCRIPCPKCSVAGLKVGMEFQEYVRRKISYDEMCRRISGRNKYIGSSIVEFNAYESDVLSRLCPDNFLAIWFEGVIGGMRMKYCVHVWESCLRDERLGFSFGGLRGLIVLDYVHGVISFLDMLVRLFVSLVECRCPVGGFYR